jgi:hypothetical protein
MDVYIYIQLYMPLIHTRGPMCEILQSCENQNMFNGNQMFMCAGIVTLQLFVFGALYYVDHYYSAFCAYTSLPRHAA